MMTRSMITGQVLLLLLCVLNAGVQAQDCAQQSPKSQLCILSSDWFKATNVSLHASSAAYDGLESYRFEIAENGDMLLTIDEKRGDKVRKGQILIIEGDIDGSVMLSRGLALQPGYEVESIDGPALTFQLAITLLYFAFPHGPDSVMESQQVDISESSQSIETVTYSANARFSAPWKLSGFVKKEQDKSIRYDLDFQYSRADTGTYNVHFSGVWEKRPGTVLFADTMSLSGWNLYRIGTIREQNNDTYRAGYGATAITESYATLADLRRALQN